VKAKAKQKRSKAKAEPEREGRLKEMNNINFCYHSSALYVGAVKQVRNGSSSIMSTFNGHPVSATSTVKSKGGAVLLLNTAHVSALTAFKPSMVRVTLF
jgi:hypothetical protein